MIQSEPNDAWREARLKQYFERKYGRYEGVIQWYENPRPDQWKFKIEETNEEILLICTDNGDVIEMSRF